MTSGPPDPDRAAGAVRVECVARIDQRDAFGPTSPRGTLRVTDGQLSWQPDGWRAVVWQVPASEVVGGAAPSVAAFELWLESDVTGTVAVRLEPPGGRWSLGGGNAPDLRGQALLDGFVEALRRGGASLAGEPRSLSSLPGTGGVGVGWPF